MEFTNDFYLFILIGLCAQLVDGALGMAYGLLSSTILLAMGMPPASVSASVHTAEVFTTGVSGGTHALMGNVDRSLFMRLAIPGVVGGVIGAYGLTQIPGDVIKPFVYTYLLLLAIFILLRAFGKKVQRGELKRVPVLGFFAGLLDASGGGGWGSIATSTLLARGGNARMTIGTVSAAEFVVSLAISLTFFFNMGLEHFDIVLGLLIGGVAAAPAAACLVKRVSERWVLFAVGTLVLCISVYQIVAALWKAALL